MYKRQGKISIPAYPFPEAAARALAKAVEYGKWLNKEAGTLPVFPDVRREEATVLVAEALHEGERWLTPKETETLLGYYGIQLVKTRYAATPQKAGLAAEQMDGAVALKAFAPGLVHKTEAGAVRLSLLGAAQTEQAAGEMLAQLQAAGVSDVEFVLQSMVPSGVEMIVGVTHDPVFGPIMVCGAGGVFVELLKDVAVRITPLTDLDAREMVRSLKTYPLLNGYRGNPPSDVKALETLLLRMSALVEDIHEIAELDLNPVIVLPEGQGVALVDARIRVAQAAPSLPFGAKKR